MFSLPPGENLAEGMSDDNPIILSGDTAAEFRHFLWTLYALYAIYALHNARLICNDPGHLN